MALNRAGLRQATSSVLHDSCNFIVALQVTFVPALRKRFPRKVLQ
ncbi:hypothetical protein Z945_1321 [Sulfitobacter noctilucae]|nr:hypothetical protein Z945_1321 [Sulfitobacter noctilucae]